MSRPRTHDRISVPVTRGRSRNRARDWPRPPRRDPHGRVTAQLLEWAGPTASVTEAGYRPWASATFLGSRHRITLRFSGADHSTEADVFADLLPHAEFSIAGHIVADACVDARRTSHGHGAEGETLLDLSILIIEDW